MERQLTNNLDMDITLHRQRQRQVVEWVKPDTFMATNFACHFGLELTMKQIHNDGFVAKNVILPSLKSTIKKQPLVTILVSSLGNSAVSISTTCTSASKSNVIHKKML
jgi:hypothetical protein